MTLMVHVFSVFQLTGTQAVRRKRTKENKTKSVHHHVTATMLSYRSDINEAWGDEFAYFLRVVLYRSM